ncbi:LEA type 2 family protein [Pseudomonas matsuisoli]|nr:LEA type 2 family protein [Pseudomonas matsuisoli]
MILYGRTAHCFRMVLCCGLLATLAGCSSWFRTDFEDPDVRLKDVEIVKARLLEQEMLLTFHIDNPNSIAIPVRGLEYDIQLNGVPLAKGESSTWFKVPAYGSKDFQVPINTNLWQHMKYIAKLLETPDKPIAYQLRGEVKTGFFFGMLGRDVHLLRNGEIIPGNYLPE